ncbi:MAG: hypothetical protein K2G63_00495 [Oscillospiraceae bacterium]|nr:hypothetical protein [Oscillospiraceae bacterium]
MPEAKIIRAVTHGKKSADNCRRNIASNDDLIQVVAERPRFSHQLVMVHPLNPDKIVSVQKRKKHQIVPE